MSDRAVAWELEWALELELEWVLAWVLAWELAWVLELVSACRGWRSIPRSGRQGIK